MWQNVRKMRRGLSVILLCLCVSLPSYSQGWKLDWNASAHLLGSTAGYLPFWARTGWDGIMPVSSSSLVHGGADLGYGDKDAWNFSAGFSLVGAAGARNPLTQDAVYGFVDRLYVSGGWKMLHADIGLLPRERSLGELSVTGGDIIYTRNARNLPGVNLWSDWIWLEKGRRVGVKGNFAHYNMIDHRHTRGGMIHNKSVALRIALGSKVSLIAGMDHWAQWGGYNPDPEWGRQPSGLKDYIKVIFGKRGGSSAAWSDRLNVLGNHLGREYLRLDWEAESFIMNFQYDKPFEDNSGMRFQNCPDGVWTLQFSLKDSRALVSGILYEFISTTWQSGPLHDRDATEEEMESQDPEDDYFGKVLLGGRDEYFNNSCYLSGWTNYGRVIGLPLFIASAPVGGVSQGVLSNRIRAHHFGMKGVLADKLPYMLKATWSRHYGRYRSWEDPFFDAHPWQVSLGFDMDFKTAFTGLPFDMSAGVYGDFGQIYPDSAGLVLRIFYKGGRQLQIGRAK